MLIYDIFISKKAEKSIALLKSAHLNKFKEIIVELRKSPFNYPYKKIRGIKHTYRTRIGDIRVLYSVDKGKLIILIIDVDNRGNIYK